MKYRPKLCVCVCVTGFGIKNHAYTVLQMSWDFFEANFIVKQVRKDIT